MSEYGVDDALEQYALILEGIDPAPMPVPAAVYAYPRDKNHIRLDRLPVIIIAERVNVRINLPTKAVGVDSDVWLAEILVFLAEGPFINSDQAMEMESNVRAWRYRRAVARRLMAYPQLNGRADYIGDGRSGGGIGGRGIGNVNWHTQAFWGVHIEQFVIQHFQQGVAY